MAYVSKRGDYWRAEVRRRGHKPVYKSFDTQRQAQQWARSIEVEIDAGTHYDRSESQRTTLADALIRYKAEVVSRKSHPAQEGYRINRWLQHSLAYRALASLRGVDFAQYRDARRAQGLAENTIRLEIQIVSHLFETARKEWGMENLANPLNNIRKPSGAHRRERRLKAGEYEVLTAELANHGNPYAVPAFQLAIETSLRQTMLFQLRWSWIDLQNQVVRIPSEFRSIANKGVPANLPLSSRAVITLQSMPRPIDGRVFGTSQNSVVMVWKRSLKKLGLTDLHWHDLRHEAVSRYFEAGLNAIEVSSITAHKNLTMLKSYAHLAAEDLARKLG